MSDIAIRAENISKAYQLGEISTGTLSRDLERAWAKLRGKEDPFLKVGEINDRTTKGKSDFIWSLKDISFEIKQGDAVGIVGRNGAGKSTLLKILSRVTTPTTGQITGTGRIASLLEVGTGFHPELTGRENIFLNGAILGMRKHEIKRKFDEIVDFSGVERYVDTPVKRYSSGMYVRLAFAVAAHLESEILIVDEVLAVGDAEFQKKCLGKMGEVSKGEGRTVLFVSHNMAAVNSLCNLAFQLKFGNLVAIDTPKKVIESYLTTEKQESYYNYLENDKYIGDASVRLRSIKVINPNFEPYESIFVTDKLGIQIEYEIKNDNLKPEPTLALKTRDDIIIIHCVGNFKQYEIGVYRVVYWIPENFLNDMDYVALIGITTSNPVTIHCEHEILFSVYDDVNAPTRGDYKDKMHGFIRPLLDRQCERIQ